MPCLLGCEPRNHLDKIASIVNSAGHLTMTGARSLQLLPLASLGCTLSGHSARSRSYERLDGADQDCQCSRIQDDIIAAVVMLISPCVAHWALRSRCVRIVRTLQYFFILPANAAVFDPNRGRIFQYPAARGILLKEAGLGF